MKLSRFLLCFLMGVLLTFLFAGPVAAATPEMLPGISSAENVAVATQALGEVQLIMDGLLLLVAIFGVIKALKNGKAKDRWSLILASIPEIHGKVQKIAKATKTQKDDKFVEQIDKILKAFNLLPIQPGEVESVKALGEGYHFEYKEQRDQLPLLQEGLELPSTE